MYNLTPIILAVVLILLLAWIMWMGGQQNIAWFVGFLIYVIGIFVGYAYRDKFHMNKNTSTFLFIIGVIGLFAVGLIVPCHERRSLMHVLGLASLEAFFGFALGISAQGIYCNHFTRSY